MNIFEALEAGKGKATLPECSSHFYVTKGNPILFNWNTHTFLTRKEMSRNDWQPYVPRETKCSNCVNLHGGKGVRVNEHGNCFYCNKEIAFPSKRPCGDKTKHTEVFENVKCLINSLGGIDLSIRACNDTDRLNKIAGKVTTMILEWQE